MGVRIDYSLKAAPILISTVALIVSIFGYRLAVETNERSKENLRYARKDDPKVAEIETKEDGAMIYAKHYAILISNTSLIPTTITHCGMEYRISRKNSWLGGVRGEACTGEFILSSEKTKNLPLLLAPGETIEYKFNQEWKLSTSQIALLKEAKSIDEFHEKDCGTDEGRRMRLLIDPSDSCLPTELRSEAGEIVLIFSTGRGAAFETLDIRWWLG